MQFFDFFRKKGKAAIPPPGMSLSKDLLPYWPAIEKTALESVHIEAKPNDQLSITQSKFGGAMYLPKGYPYPVDKDGNYMFPLAQLNFSEIPALQGYPQKGLLQFYIANDDIYGLNLDDQTKQDSFRVLYFEQADESTAEKDFGFLKDAAFEQAPMNTSMELHFSKTIDYGGISDVRFEKHFGMNCYQWAEQFGTKEDAIFTEMSELFGCWGNKIGGYADFTQEDPRSDTDMEDWILLLQISS